MNSIRESTPQTPVLYQALSWLVTLLIPVALTLAAVRLMLTPVYINIEYRLPGFPFDRYGFSTSQRLEYADIAIQYLLNPAGIDFLSDLKLEDGQPMYNQRELEHMVDVKDVVRIALAIWYFSLLALLGLGLWAWFGRWWNVYRRGLGRGGWLTVFLLGTLVLLVVISFGFIFVAFHNVFFAAGTWTFNYSDTLIRLFPERFWRDIFLWVGGLTLAGGLLLAYIFGRNQRISKS